VSGVNIGSVHTKPEGTEGMGREISLPVCNDQCNKFIVQIGLLACISMKSILDVRRVVTFGVLRHKGEPLVLLPFEVLEGLSHLFDSELDLLFILFSSCLALCSLDTVKILTLHIGGGAVC